MKLKNHVADEHGLYEHELLVQAGTTVPVLPDTQLFVGPSYTLLFHSGDIYPVVRTTNPWSLGAAHTLYDLAGGAGTIAAGGRWHMAMFEQGWIACNGACMVFQEPGGNVIVDTDAYPLTCCEVNGRAFFGGVGRYYTLTNAVSGANETLYGEALTNVADNWVQWCSVQGLDILWPQYPARMMADHDTPAYDNDVGRAVQEDFKNQRGLSPTSGNGVVLCMKQLGNNAIAYTSDSIWAFLPVTVEPNYYATFGKIKIADYGVMGRGAVCGDLQRHVFVDRLGMVRELRADFSLIDRGYEEFFVESWVASNASELVAEWDASRQRAYITGTYGAEVRTFVLTPSGLSMLGIEQVVTVAGVRDYAAGGAELQGLSVVTADDVFELETDEMDLGQAGVKYVKSAYVGGTLPSDLTGKLFYRMSEQAAWSDTGWIAADKSGYIDFHQSCLDCRLALTCGNYTQLQLHTVLLEFDPVGKYTARDVLTRQS